MKLDCINPNKYEFFRDRLEYLGHVVSSKVIETNPRKIAAIINWPRPKNITQISSFLGFCNYYRKFIRGYAQVAKPLYQLLIGENAKKKTNEFEWTEQCKQAFNKLKAFVVTHLYEHTQTIANVSRYTLMLQSKAWVWCYIRIRMMAQPG